MNEKLSRLEDPFVSQFFERIPAESRESFNDEQLAAIKAAFGNRHWGRHTIDIRFPLRRGRSYLVLLMGQEKRSAERLAFDRALRPAATLLSSIAIVVIGLVFMTAIGGSFYAIKSIAHIDMFPGVDVLPDEWIKKLLE